MTLYEYRCKKCGVLFTKFRRVEDRNKVTPCPDCGGPGFRKLSVPQHYKYVWSSPADPEKLNRTKEIWE